jgi:hypothetical protein
VEKDLTNVCRVTGKVAKIEIISFNGKEKTKLYIKYADGINNSVFDIKKRCEEAVSRLVEGDTVIVSFNPCYVTTPSGVDIAVNFAYSVKIIN